MALDICRQRVPLTTCARCRKPFKAGDRALPAYIILNTQVRHPETRELVSEMSGDFEFVHASCVDPSLDGRLLVTT